MFCALVMYGLGHKPTFAAQKDMSAWTILLTIGMVVGMITTIAIFAVAAVLLRERIVHLMDRTARTRERFGQILELVGAAAIIGFGLWLLAGR